MSRVLHDLSRPLAAATAPWPGDTPFEFRETWQISAGSSVNVGAFTASTHFATHVDAPWHYDPAGARIDDLPLELFFGPAAVLDARGWAEIGVDFFVGQRLAPRVLLRTDGWLDSTIFPLDYPLLQPAAAAWLAQNGVRLLGLDLPSVDRAESRDLPVHHALRRAGIIILESLWLQDVPAGYYQLAAFPLRLSGADAAPVRAVLLEATAESH